MPRISLTNMVDVRDMLCAQALALVAQAVAKLHSGEALTVRYNTEDVRRDLLVWAREQGCGVRPVSNTMLRIAVPPHGV